MVEEVKHISKAEDGTITTIKTIKTVKKSVKKKKKKKKSSRPKTYNKSRMTAKEREELLIENFVGLQKAMTHLSIKFEGLSTNISRLLEIFELSAKAQLEKSPDFPDKELLVKVNSIIDQNKTIAKGLVSLNEKVSLPPKQIQSIPSMSQPQNPSLQNSGQQPQVQTQQRMNLRSKPLPRI